MATKPASVPKVTDDTTSLADTSKSPKAKTQGSSTAFALTPDNLFQAWNDSETYTNILNEPFPEFQRMAQALPYPELAKKFPKVAEGSTGAYIEQKPRQLIQQTPTGNVTAEYPGALPPGWSLEAFSLVAQWELDFEIIPHATEDYPVFEKAQHGMEQALGVGFTVTSAPFYNHDGVWTADMTMMYWGDVKVPAGYKAIKPMPYTFLEGWWPKERVDAIVNMDPKTAKQGGWDQAAVKLSQDTLSSKDYKSETPVEKSRGLPENYYRVVIAHQNGVKAPIYTFNPDTKSIIRTKPNPDPRGHKNIQTLYGKTDGTNPFGVSIFERGVGAWQNLMDNDVQAYQYNRAYNVDPAVKRMGNIGDGELRPGASFTAQTESDDITTIEINSQTLTDFPQLYEWQRAVLMSRLTAPTSANGATGEAPMGKTPIGIAKASNMISTDDLTYVTHVHSWFQEYCETAINVTFAERKGKQSLTLDDATADQLRALSAQDPPKFDAKLLNGNTLMFDFDQPLPIFRFEVDATSSKIQDEVAQLQALESISGTIEQSPTLQQLTGALMAAKIYNKMVAISGVHDASDLEIDIKQLEDQMKQAQEAQSQQGDQSEEARLAQEAKPPSGSIAYKDMQPFGQLQMAAEAGIKLRPQDVGLNPDLSPMPAPPVDPNAPVKGKKGQIVPPIVPPSAQPTPTDVANPPANPQVPKEIIQAVTTLTQHGLPEVLVPHAIQALTEGVPLQAILDSISTPELANIKAKVAPNGK